MIPAEQRVRVFHCTSQTTRHRQIHHQSLVNNHYSTRATLRYIREQSITCHVLSGDVVDGQRDVAGVTRQPYRVIAGVTRRDVTR